MVNQSEAERTLVYSDWAQALRDQPMWAVELACQRWLETEKRKPAPADIIGKLPLDVKLAKQSLAILQDGLERMP